jgi:hypothetical protein
MQLLLATGDGSILYAASNGTLYRITIDNTVVVVLEGYISDMVLADTRLVVSIGKSVLVLNMTTLETVSTK